MWLIALTVAQTPDGVDRSWTGWLSGVAPMLLVIGLAALIVVAIRRRRGDH